LSNTSFDKIIDKVFDGFKKITPALVAVAIMSGLVLFLPNSVLNKLRLDILPDSVLFSAGLLFLLSCTLILTILGSVIFQSIVKKVKYVMQLNDLRKRYLQLSLPQKRIVIKLLKSSDKSVELDSLSGDTIYLIQHDIIFRPQQNVSFVELDENRYTYAPHPWLLDLFQKEPELFNIEREKKNIGD